MREWARQGGSYEWRGERCNGWTKHEAAGSAREVAGKSREGGGMEGGREGERKGGIEEGMDDESGGGRKK